MNELSNIDIYMNVSYVEGHEQESSLYVKALYSVSIDNTLISLC
jgi:hypothetical protein